MAQAVGDDVALSSLDLLTRIVASRAAAFGCLDRLAVDDRRSRRSVPSLDDTARGDQRVVDRKQHSAVPPTVKMILNGREWPKVRG